MLVIGIVGGIGSGKTLVAEELERLGAKVLDADRVGHAVLAEPEIRRILHDRWGDRVLRSDGQIDRRKVAEIVFAPSPDGPIELQYLEQLTHPRIRQRLENQIHDLTEQGVRVAVLDAPVMMKAGWDKRCDKMVFVDAPRPVRLARCVSRGWSKQDYERREAAQQSLESKRERADVVIDNSGSRESTQQQVRRFWYTVFG